LQHTPVDHVKAVVDMVHEYVNMYTGTQV